MSIRSACCRIDSPFLEVRCGWGQTLLPASPRPSPTPPGTQAHLLTRRLRLLRSAPGGLCWALGRGGQSGGRSRECPRPPRRWGQKADRWLTRDLGPQGLILGLWCQSMDRYPVPNLRRGPAPPGPSAPAPALVVPLAARAWGRASLTLGPSFLPRELAGLLSHEGPWRDSHQEPVG